MKRLVKPLDIKMNRYRMIVTSDIHLMTDSSVNNKILPLMSHSLEMLEAFIEDVLSVSPQVVILLGDNTNSGKRTEREALAKGLRRLTDAGIEVILCPGNHDFNQCSNQEYKACYGWLYEGVDRDPSSLSYAKDLLGYRFLAMDDSSLERGISGRFTEETMDWLERQLLDAQQKHKKPIFLSHHSVIGEDWMIQKAHYCIQNDSLLSMLKKYDVRLALSGHLHQQCIHHSDRLTEIVQTMYMKGNHLIGELSSVGPMMEYRVRPLRIEDSSLLEVVSVKKDVEKANRIESYTKLLGSADRANLMNRWVEASEEGRLLKEKKQIEADIHYADFVEHLEEPSYRKWFNVSMEKPQEADRVMVLFPKYTEGSHD